MWRYAAAVVAVGALLSNVVQAQPQPGKCYPVHGKIVNNGNTPVPLHTLGVAAVVFDTTTKLKCALEGTPDLPLDPQNNIAFTHTVSCDDQISTPAGLVHSKLRLHTEGNVDLATGFFTERSTPIEGSGTGLFAGIKADGSSFLHIEGRILFISNTDMTIDQKFTGLACY